jgi:hypothetical protein
VDSHSLLVEGRKEGRKRIDERIRELIVDDEKRPVWSPEIGRASG